MFHNHTAGGAQLQVAPEDGTGDANDDEAEDDDDEEEDDENELMVLDPGHVSALNSKPSCLYFILDLMLCHF